MKSSGETSDRLSAETALVAAAVPRELAHARAACPFEVFPPPTACDALFCHPAPNLRRNRILAAEPLDSADVSAQLCDLRFPANAMRRYAFQERFDRAITDEMHRKAWALLATIIEYLSMDASDDAKPQQESLHVVRQPFGR